MMSSFQVVRHALLAGLFWAFARGLSVPQETAEVNLKRELRGPAAMKAFKLSLGKVSSIPLPDSILTEGPVNEAEIDRKLKSSFDILMAASDGSWLLNSQELGEVRKRFRRWALRPSKQALKGSPTMQFWENWWQEVKAGFQAAFFDDGKTLFKPHTPDESARMVMEKIGHAVPYTHQGSAATAFTVLTGSCTVDGNGCLLSPHFPANYTNRGACIVSVAAGTTGPVQVPTFETETGVDFVLMNGVRYSGSNKPVGIPEGDLVWFSDFGSTAPGFMICPTPPLPEGQKEEEVKPVGNLTVLSGDCTIDSAGCMMSPAYPNNYPNGGRCEIVASPEFDLPLSVDSFDTEKDYDGLNVNGEWYSGVDGPDGVVPKGTMKWVADESFAGKGFKICPGKAEEDEAEQISPVNETFFLVRSGRCSTDALGCVRSPEYPNYYKNGETCIIGLNASNIGRLHVHGFSTETEYDALIVNGIRFSGVTGPEGLTPFEDLLWVADAATTSTGWKICMGAPEAVAPPAVSPADAFTVADGGCTVDGGCIASPGYPHAYGNHESCTIEVAKGVDMRLQVKDFSTESQIDSLVVNNKSYSGNHGPDGVIPQGQITWTSDSSKVMDGWRICVVEPAPLPATSTAPPTTITTTVTTTTVTTTTEDPLTEPWTQLGYHKNISDTMTKCMKTLDAKVDGFLLKADTFKSALDVRSTPNQAAGTVSVLVDKVSSGLAPVLDAWKQLTDDMRMHFSHLRGVLKENAQGDDLIARAEWVANASARFTASVEWFATEVTGELEVMKSLGPWLPKTLEPLRVPFRTFTELLNGFVHETFERFDAVTKRLRVQVSERFVVLGSGACEDKSGKHYDTYESQGCETTLDCMLACQKLGNSTACRGFTITFPTDIVNTDNACGRCELRVDDGTSAVDDEWKAAWSDGTASGEVVGADGVSPEGKERQCFRRQAHDITSFSPVMSKALLKSQSDVQDHYLIAHEIWAVISADIKSAFWRIMSAIEETLENAVKSAASAAK